MTGIALGALGILAVLLLTAGTAVFVAAEYALTTLERVQVDGHVEQVGDRRARQVQRAHRSLSFQLSGAQLGITITTLITGYIAEPALAAILSPALTAIGIPDNVAEGISLVIALLLATAVSMIFGELVPKNLAIASPLRTARAVAGVQYGFSTALRWLINALNGAANWIVRRLGVEPAEELRSARSPQELGSLVRASAKHGVLDEGTATLLDRSLRFGDRTAEELMTPRVKIEALRADATVVDLIEASRRTGYSRFPVHDEDVDDIRGLVHVKQAFGLPAAQWSHTPVGPLARVVPRVPETLSGDVLLDRLRVADLQVALVEDEYGGTAGLVTLEDLVEEIVGDVRDEHDNGEVPQVKPLDQDNWLLSGLLRADEVAEATGFEMPDGEYETLAGMVVERLGRIPSTGDDLRLDGWRITVVEMDRHRVAELRLLRENERGPAAPPGSPREYA
jgi:CBS domain containing-hemolysin-like protein